MGDIGGEVSSILFLRPTQGITGEGGDSAKSEDCDSTSSSKEIRSRSIGSDKVMQSNRDFNAEIDTWYFGS